jgi:hypothetical protein
LTAGDRARLTELLSQPLNWQIVSKEAAWHGLTPLVHHHLRSVHDSAPETIWSEIRACAAAVAVSNHLLLARLSEVQAALGRRGVANVCLKGPVLAHQVFGLALRPCGDLDVLVRAADAEQAVAALLELGYEPEPQDVLSWQREWIASTYELQFNHPRSRTRIDLHWRLFHAGYRLFPSEKALWDRSVEATVDGVRFRTLGREDGLHYLAFHAARHDWEALRWLADVAESLRSAEVDWQLLERRQSEWGTERMWHATLALCAEWLGLELPQDAARSVASDLNAQDLARRVGMHWVAGAPTFARPAELPWRTLFYRGLESRRDRARMVSDLWTKPSINDWRFCSLPRVLWPLYAVLRPFRIVAQRGNHAYNKHAP